MKRCKSRGLIRMKLLPNELKMKSPCFLVLLCLNLTLSAASYSQSLRLSFTSQEIALTEVLSAIRNQSHYTFVYNVEDIQGIKVKAVHFKEATLDEVLNEYLKNSGFTWIVEDQVVILRQLQTAKEHKLTGIVKDAAGNSLPGVSVLIQGTTIGVATDMDGKFTLSVPSPDKVTLQFSFIGMKTKTITVNDEKPITVVLEENATEMDEVVVNAGYFQKTKESFTGSEVTVKAEELKKVGSLNVLQALNAIDPAIRLTEDLANGSDPNRIPEITIRGENGFDLRSNADDSRTNPNAPLYMLDGVEVSAQRIYDLDMNRIEEMTILKDATATALYGSRGANGVILITTLRPRAGKIRINANANFNISIPDLRDYNLMNAKEKLQYEQLSGAYVKKSWEDQLLADRVYNQRMEQMLTGVDTYWLSKPLQTAVNQRYSVNFEGGDEHFRYGIDLRYLGDKGVMKESGRDNYGLSVIFQYNIGENFFIRNDVLADIVKGDNSPYGSFSTWASQNPYDRIYDDEGKLVQKLSSGDYNPMIYATLPNFSTNEYTSVQDNFNIDWRIIPSLRLQGRFSYTRQLDKAEDFKSPKSPEFQYVASDVEDAEKNRGSYYIRNDKEERTDGNMTLSYFRNIGKSVLNIGLGTNIQSSSSKGDWYTATGFVSESMNFIGAGTAFQYNSKPSGQYDKSRLIGFFANVNYGWDNRYFVDFSYRTDGSSKFGRNSRFAPFWSAGLAWNVHKEHFVNWDERNTLKIRLSAGSTGSVNFKP